MASLGGGRRKTLRFAKLTRWIAPPLSAAPPTFDVVFAYYQRDPAYSLGLASISAYLKRSDPDVRVHLVPIYRDDAVEKIVDLVRKVAPKLLAVAAMSPTWLPSDPYLRGIRAALPRLPVVVGGYQAIVDPEDTIAHPCVDYVCLGDGEEPLEALVRRLRGRRAPDLPIPGLWEKRSRGRIARQPPSAPIPLEDLPFPDYSIFEREGAIHWLSPKAIQSERLTTVPIVSGRGCPYRCSYCANTTLLDKFGGKGSLLRKFPPEAFVDHLVEIRDRYDVDYFQFWDEEFLYDMRYAGRLLELYTAKVDRPWSAFARVENMDDEVCRRIADTGCHSVWFGIESGSESYRREYLGRRMTNRAIQEAAAHAERNGIKRFGFNMVGMPFETKVDMRRTIDLSRNIAPELTVFSQYLPLPGTPLYELCRQKDLLLDPAVERQMWPLGELNIREHPEGATNEEMREVASEVMAYLDSHNRFDA